MFVYISVLDGLGCRSKRKTKNGELLLYVLSHWKKNQAEKALGTS